MFLHYSSSNVLLRSETSIDTLIIVGRENISSVLEILNRFLVDVALINTRFSDRIKYPREYQCYKYPKRTEQTGVRMLNLGEQDAEETIHHALPGVSNHLLHRSSLSQWKFDAFAENKEVLAEI